MMLTLPSSKLESVLRILHTHEPLLLCTREGECLTKIMIRTVDYQNDSWEDKATVNVELVALHEVPVSFFKSLK